jgi:hypothetical protein
MYCPTSVDTNPTGTRVTDSGVDESGLDGWDFLFLAGLVYLSLISYRVF